MKSRRSYFRIWVVPVLLWAVLLAVLAYWQLGRREPEHTKVMIIGVDSLNWDVVNPLLEDGRLPNLKRLIDEGTSGLLMSRPVTNSPIIWTTIATGKRREEHGIRSFMKKNPETGSQVPYTSADRKVAALWNMASVENRTVACFGWWVTWPAEEVNGVMVSSFAAMEPDAPVRRGIHQDRILNKLTWPDSLYGEIQDLVVPVDSVKRKDLERFVNIDDWDHPMFEYGNFAEGVTYVLPWTYSTDLTYVNIMEEMLGRRNFDLSMVYIQGTDSLSHRFWMCRDDVEGLRDNMERYGLPLQYEDDIRRYFGETIDKYYEFTDELIGRLLAFVDDQTVVIVCSDHGFGTLEDPWPDGEKEFTYYGGHYDEGSIILWGPGIRKGKTLSRSSMPFIWDVAPTVLAIMALPIAQDMEGAPVMEAFDARFTEEYNPVFIETYDVDYEAGEEPEEVPMSREYEERLRSLGYIQ